MWIDTHCHLHDPRFDGDRDEVIRRARDDGVEQFITVGTDLDTSRAALDLAERHDAVSATVGFHPHEVRHCRDEDLPRLEEMARHPRVVGFGEIGLDDHYMYSPSEVQRERFRDQIRLAIHLRLPLVLHIRLAFSDALRILREERAARIGGVFHCFTGDSEIAREALQLGFYLSFSGILTFQNAGAIREAARLTPADRLLIETDSPYLAPVPHRGRRNEPAHVRHVGAELGRVQGIEADEIRRLTTANARRLFPRLVDSGS
jgi:TatD DNase family protein